MMRAIFGTSGLRDEGVVIAEIDKAIFEDRFRPLEEKRQFGILSVESGSGFFTESNMGFR